MTGDLFALSHGRECHPAGARLAGMDSAHEAVTLGHPPTTGTYLIVFGNPDRPSLILMHALVESVLPWPGVSYDTLGGVERPIRDRPPVLGWALPTPENFVALSTWVIGLQLVAHDHGVHLAREWRARRKTS